MTRLVLVLFHYAEKIAVDRTMTIYQMKVLNQDMNTVNQNMNTVIQNINAAWPSGKQVRLVIHRPLIRREFEPCQQPSLFYLSKKFYPH